MAAAHTGSSNWAGAPPSRQKWGGTTEVRRFVRFEFKDQDGKKKVRLECEECEKTVRRCHLSSLRRTQSHPGKKTKERALPVQSKEGRKEEKGRKRWQERSLLPSSSPMFGVETPRNDKTGRPVWLSSRPPSPQNHSGSARLPV